MAKGFFFSSIRSSSRVRVSLPIVKFNGISNYLQIVTAQFYSHGKSNDARLFERLYHWYNSDIVDKRKNDFVFESWMLTSDSIPNNYNSSSPFFRRFFQLPALSFLSSLVFCLGLFFVAGFASEVYGQNQIDANIQVIPRENKQAKLILTNNSTGEKTTVRSDSLTGKLIYKPNIPEGEYTITVEAEGAYKYKRNNVTINENQILEIQPIEDLGKTSTYFNKNLEEFMVETNTYPGMQYDEIKSWVSYKNIRLYANNPTMPAGWRAGFDRVINDVTTKSEGEITFREEQTDSLGGIRFFFVPTNEIPGGGAGSRGYTFIGLNGFGYYEAWCYVATDLNDSLQAESVMAREMGRALGLHSFSPDITFVMYTNWRNGNNTFHPDEGKVLEILSQIKSGTNMRNYDTTVTQDINWPAEKTSNINDLNLLEDAEETFLAKLTEHFVDPENSSLTYNVSGENIVTRISSDSLFIKPVAGFYGDIELIVKATDDLGQTSEPDTVNITVTHVNHAPTQPTPISPINNMVLNNKDQFFFWTESSDPDGDLVSYSLRVFNESKDTTVTEISVTSFNFTDIQRLGFGQFYKWFVSSTDGEFVINSDTLIFKIKDYQQQKPDLLSPLNNDTLKSKDMNFVWTKTLGPNGEKGTYLLTIFNSEKDTSFYTDTNNVQLFTNIQTALGSEKDYRWYVLSNDGFTNISSDTSRFNTGLITDIKDEWKNRKGFSLFNNYPNPFNGTTVISYTIAKAGNVRLSIYNSLGEEIAILVNGYQSENYYEVSFNAVNIPSGIYYYRIDATASDGSESFSSVKKLVLLK